VSGDPQEDFEEAWIGDGYRASTAEAAAAAAVTVAIGVPLLLASAVLDRASRAWTRIKGWTAPEEAFVGCLTNEQIDEEM
jgi:uroporphyrinogen-III decarboxylase